ncbi:MAG TPA: hypothetical protein VF426_01060 [Marmoricola sp.]
MSPRSSSLTHPRGRLPARVYWTRRGLVAVTAIAMLFGFAHLLGALGGGSGGGNHAAQLSADQTTAPSVGASQPPASEQPYVASSSQGASPGAGLAVPEGPCSPADLSVTPVVRHAYALHPVTITLQLSGAAAACNFTVSSKTVAVKITSGTDGIWSSQDCPQVIKKQDVVVRSGSNTNVALTWRGHRSNGTCSVANKWALPGYYHVLAAVMGSTPTDAQFKMTVAPRAVITKTAHPKPKKKAHKPSAHASGGSGTSGKGSKCGGDNAANSC